MDVLTLTITLTLTLTLSLTLTLTLELTLTLTLTLTTLGSWGAGSFGLCAESSCAHRLLSHIMGT